MNISVFVMTVLIFTQPQDKLDVDVTLLTHGLATTTMYANEAACEAAWQEVASDVIDTVILIDGVVNVKVECTPVDLELLNGHSS